MIVSLLASLLGIFGAALPEVLKLFREGKDRAHEYRMLQLQIDNQDKIRQGRIEEIGMMADIAEMQSLATRTPRTNIKWVNAADQLVRPIMAYWFLLVYTVMKVGQYCALVAEPTLPWQEASSWWTAVTQLWTQEDQAIFVTIVTYYFGKRSFEKYRNH